MNSISDSEFWSPARDAVEASHLLFEAKCMCRPCDGSGIESSEKMDMTFNEIQ